MSAVVQATHPLPHYGVTIKGQQRRLFAGPDGLNDETAKKIEDGLATGTFESLSKIARAGSGDAADAQAAAAAIVASQEAAAAAEQAQAEQAEAAKSNDRNQRGS